VGRTNEWHLPWGWQNCENDQEIIVKKIIHEIQIILVPACLQSKHKIIKPSASVLLMVDTSQSHHYKNVVDALEKLTTT